MNERLEYLSKKARALTLSPGVYIMKNKKEEIIYIGKAKVLKNRVSQYFQPNNPSHTEKVKRMVEQVYDFDYIVVDSEFEALVLECSLIKQNSPKYNILLKDDKGYHYIEITSGNYPRINAQKQVPKDYKELLGPYTSSYSVSQTVDEVNKIFCLPTCTKKFPQDIKKSRPCLNYYIKQCMGVCRGNISKEEYNQTLSEAIAYIKKGNVNLVDGLEQQMNEAAEQLDFERAAKLRDRIQAIKHITDTQKVYMINTKNQDIVAFTQNSTFAAVSILKFRNFKLSDKEDHVFSDVDELDVLRREFLEQYYLQNEDIPPSIVIDEDFEGSELLAEYLTEKQNRKIQIVVPERGEKRKMTDMALKNAAEKLSKRVERTGREVVALDELRKVLGLSGTPEYIEAYDISNLGESDIIGAMVVFKNGRPLKSAYKKFKIKEVSGQDDYSSMREMISRRLSHYNEDKETGEGFGKLPDLILLDGGKGHVAAISPVISSFNMNIPLFGMVKDSHHRTRAIAADGGEIAIAANRSVFSFITNIQDEVHRYAINYQRVARKKTAFEVTLTRVEGIGEKKAQALLKQYKTKSALLKASPEELQKAAKVNEKTANELYKFIHAV